MPARRAALLITGLVVAGLGALFAVSEWDRASRIATLVSALAAVAAVGVAVWAALPGAAAMIRVTNTGSAAARAGGKAISGLAGPTTGLPDRVEVDHTGEADASRGGDATTGVDLS